MCDDCKEVFTNHFDNKFKKACKKHKHCFENDFNVLLKTLKANKKETPQSEKISGLGQNYAQWAVYKTRMHITELRRYDARAIWHFDEIKNSLLFIDIYLKVNQKNHDASKIKETLDWYYPSPKNNGV